VQRRRRRQQASDDIKEEHERGKQQTIAARSRRSCADCKAGPGERHSSLSTAVIHSRYSHSRHYFKHQYMQITCRRCAPVTHTKMTPSSCRQPMLSLRISSSAMVPYGRSWWISHGCVAAVRQKFVSGMANRYGAQQEHWRAVCGFV